MRFVFRADASVTQGSGHVMRCLTLAEEVVAEGHEVVFASAVASIGWLDAALRDSGYPTVAVEVDRIDRDALLALEPDWVVVDSYRIAAGEISALDEAVAVLAIVDGDARGIEAALYLEQNLGSDNQPWPGRESRMLAGAHYALIRDGFISARRPNPARIIDVPHVTAFMGGTDPTGVIVAVAEQLALVSMPFTLTVVAPERFHGEVAAALPAAQVIAPTTDLPALLGRSDVIVSAAGTSAWDVCTLAVPALFIGVVDNQSASLRALIDGGYALGVDLAAGGDVTEIAPAVASLLSNQALRDSLSARCAGQFDGLGKNRVVAAMTASTRSPR